MKIVVAPCGIRERMTPKEMADHIEKGIRRAAPEAEVKLYPLLKGDDPLEQLTAFNGTIIEADASDPLGRSIKASYGVFCDKFALIDLKQASGLGRLTEEERNPLLTSTFGTGQLILDALDRGLREFFIFTKGTSTNDGGIGILSAIGYRFLGSDGESVPLNGKGLYAIRSIDEKSADERLKECSFTLVTDYINLYSGVRGIAYGYGPLKGANPLMIQSLDRGLRNYAIEVEKATGVDVEKTRGTGAGGGTGAGLVAFLKADIISFVEAFRIITGVDDDIRSADLVITGAGKAGSLDKIHKGMLATAQMSQRNHIPLVGLFGYLDDEYNELYTRGFSGIYALYNDRNPSDIQWEKAGMLLEKMSEAVVQLTME